MFYEGFRFNFQMQYSKPKDASFVKNGHYVFQQNATTVFEKRSKVFLFNKNEYCAG
jgi:hypothetical protein